MKRETQLQKNTTFNFEGYYSPNTSIVPKTYALEEAGVKNGLPRETALKLAAQAALGTAKLILENNIRPEELIKMVASPKGTTMAGLEVLDRSNAKAILEKAVEAAARKSKELAK